MFSYRQKYIKNICLSKALMFILPAQDDSGGFEIQGKEIEIVFMLVSAAFSSKKSGIQTLSFDIPR